MIGAGAGVRPFVSTRIVVDHDAGDLRGEQ